MFNKKKKQQLPEVYTEAEMEAIEAHIEAHFGKFPNVFHEILSPDIHVDICIIEPTTERNYYTLATMGMGAHRMNVPKELREHKLDRAELFLCLPPDWEIQNDDERWYWPIRLLKSTARLPGECDTWLGYGHTLAAETPESYAENTQLCGVMLTMPYQFEQASATCALPDDSEVNFYQLLPLYEEEMNYKLAHCAEDLEALLGEDFDFVVNPVRRNAIRDRKNYLLQPTDMKDLLPDWEGPTGCICTDRILVDGCKVGYMYREAPDADSDMPDSGWRFTAGDESDDYMDNAGNSGIYAVNTIANYDPEIIPFLSAPYGTAYARDENGRFREEAFVPPEE